MNAEELQDATTGDRPLILVIWGVLFCALLGAGFAWELGPRLHGSSEWSRERMEVAGFWSGGKARVVAEHLEESSPIARSLRPLYNRYLFLVSGVPGARVVVGDDMLFERARVEPRAAAFWQERDAAIRACVAPLVQRLRHLGIELLVAPVPESVRIYPEQLPEWGRSANAPAWATLLETLRSSGAEVVDLAGALRAERRRHPEQRLFRRDDHHWTLHGSVVAARAIASRLRTLWGVESRDLGLTTTTIESEDPGSYLILAGWPRDCEAWRRFAEPKRESRVLRPDGRDYVAPLDGEVIMVCDSFGGFDTAALVALHADHPITDLWVAGRGAAYPMAELLHLLGSGMRPRGVIWLFEEFATFRPSQPWEGLLLAETLPDMGGGAWEDPLLMAAVRSRDAAPIVRSERELVLTASLQGISLSLPPPPRDATHLVVELQAPSGKRVRGRSTIGMGPDDARDSPERQALVLDRFRGRWQRTCLPVEASRGNPAMLILKTPLAGKRFRFRRFAWLRSPWPAPAEGALTWTPETVRVASAGPAGEFASPGDPVALPFTVVDDEPRILVAAAAAQRFVLEPAIPGSGRLPLVVAIDAAGAEQGGPLVLRLALRDPTGAITVFWRELRVEPRGAQRIPLDLPVTSDSVVLEIDIRPAAHLAGKVGAAILFPR